MSHRDRVLALDDARLEAECEISVARGSGPGGQKRNKTSTSVRLTHRLCGVSVVCDETRSQAKNRRLALRRLRPRLALECREEPSSMVGFEGQLDRPEPSGRFFWAAVARVLDMLEAQQGAVRRAAQALGLSTSQLSRFLRAHALVFRAANELRARHGRRPLRS